MFDENTGVEVIVVPKDVLVPPPWQALQLASPGEFVKPAIPPLLLIIKAEVLNNVTKMTDVVMSCFFM